MNLQIQPLIKDNIQEIAAAFEAIGWSSHKPAAQYERYLQEQDSGTRTVLVAWVNSGFAGYLTVLWQSNYQPFCDAGIPEVSDFNVLPAFRRRKVGTRLMDQAESDISAVADAAGIGVGLYPDYGNAQRLYVRRGYMPDGRGVTYAGKVLEPMAETVNDDNLVLYFTKKLR